MHPKEERLAAAAVDPLHGVVHRIAGAALRILQEFLAVARPGHTVVVDRESLVEPKSPFQHRRAYEGPRVPATLLKQAGQRRCGPGEDEPSGVPHFVAGRVETSEDAGMRGRRQIGRASWRGRLLLSGVAV